MVPLLSNLINSTYESINKRYVFELPLEININNLYDIKSEKRLNKKVYKKLYTFKNQIF